MPETDFLAFHAIDPVGRDVMVASLRLRIISREFDLVALDVIQIESLHDELKIELDASGVLWMRPAVPSQCSRSLSEARVPSRTGHLRDCVSRVMRVLNARVRPSRGGFTAARLTARSNAPRIS